MRLCIVLLLGMMFMLVVIEATGPLQPQRTMYDDDDDDDDDPTTKLEPDPDRHIRRTSKKKIAAVAKSLFSAFWKTGPVVSEDGKAVDPKQHEETQAWDKKDEAAATDFLEVEGKIMALAKSKAAPGVITPMPMPTGTTPTCIVDADWDKAISLLPAAGDAAPVLSTGVTINSAPYGPRYMHMFAMFSHPVDYRGADCYDPKLEYEDTLDAVTANSDEFKRGCTAVRTSAMVVQQFTKCLRADSFPAPPPDPSGKVHKPADKRISFRADDYCILYKLAFYASTVPENQFVDTALAAIFRRCARNDEHDSLSNRQKQRVRNCMTLNYRDHDAVPGFPAQLYRHIPCLSGMSGSAGMIGRGLNPHTENWVDADDLEVTKECKVHPICARAAASWVNNFQTRDYNTMSYWGATQPSSDRCRNNAWYGEKSGRGNCRLYAKCFDRALRKLCKAESKCCPTKKIHTSCAKHTTNSDCRELCSSP